MIQRLTLDESDKCWFRLGVIAEFSAVAENQRFPFTIAALSKSEPREGTSILI